MKAASLQHYVWRNKINSVIQSFHCKETQALFGGRSPRRFRAIARVAERKLAQLDAARTLDFLRAPPGNRLEALKGDRAGQHSIRINDQWRVCFEWSAAGPLDVEIVDYHQVRSMNRTAARPVNRLRPVHPGEVLREDYLVPLGLSVNALATALGVPATRIHEIVNERRGVTADTATRLAKHFGGDAASWLALQASHDLKTLATRAEIERSVMPRGRASA